MFRSPYVLYYRMCILASRDHTCIHPFVSNAKNKTEECRKSVEQREVSCITAHVDGHLRELRLIECNIYVR
jgi:hypothetical protein